MVLGFNRKVEKLYALVKQDENNEPSHQTITGIIVPYNYEDDEVLVIPYIKNQTQITAFRKNVEKIYIDMDKMRNDKLVDPNIEKTPSQEFTIVKMPDEYNDCPVVVMPINPDDSFMSLNDWIKHSK